MRNLFILTILTVFIFLGISDVCAQIPTENLHYKKWLQNWLICGPFPNILAEGVTDYRHDQTTLGYYIDFLQKLGGEADVHPQEGQTLIWKDGENYQWKDWQSAQDYIDLTAVYKKNQGVVAYAACQVIADKVQEAVLALGSNDGIKAWLNGALIWDNHLPRGAERDQDWIRVSLKEGTNLLLLKIDQGGGRWGFYARFLDLAGQRMALSEIRPNTQEMRTETKVGEKRVQLTMGRHARYLIMDQVPVYSARIRGIHGATGETYSTVLGDSLIIPVNNLEPGPYWIDCTVNLPGSQIVEESIFFFQGESPHKIITYDQQGEAASMVVELLDADFEPVADALREDTTGRYSLLRPDITPFFLRMLVKSAALGYYWLLADNAGQGFTIPENKSLSVDLPYEAAKSLRLKVQNILSGNMAPGMRKEMEQRLAGVKTGEPKANYRLYDRLSTMKKTLRADPSLSIWTAPGIEKIAREETIPVTCMDTIYLSLARNEYEPFQLVFRAGRPLENLKIRFKPLSNKSGVLDPSHISMLKVEYVQIKQPSDLYGTEGLWPDPLPTPDGYISLEANQNQPFWLTVFAPKDQPAGIYRGEINVSADGLPDIRLPWQIEVYDFTLPDEPAIETAYGVFVDRDYHGPIAGDQLRETHDLYMQLCASHRISPYMPQAGAGIDIRYEGNPAKPQIDYTAFDRAMKRYLDLFKFTSFNMGGIPGTLNGYERYTEQYNRLFQLTYAAIQEHLREKGWLEKAYWYWVDEPPISEYANVKKGMALLNAACPDIRRLLTCNNEDAPIPYFYDYVNLWVPIMDRFNEEKSGERQELGETVWWYVCTGPKGPYPNNFIDHPAINHRIRFWMIDKFGLNGSLYWSATYWRQNPWETAMSVSPEGGTWGNGDGRLLYPPAKIKPSLPLVKAPVTSIRFEILRDGIEDVAYLKLLKAKFSESGLLLEDTGSKLVHTMTVFEQNPLIFTVMRQRIARAIESQQ